MKICKQASLLVALLMGVAVLSAGCESTESAEDALTVTVNPADGVLVGKNATATLTASLSNTDTNSLEELVLPLEWRVSNGSLGRIANSAGVSAVYISNGSEGANTITVSDQIGRSGIAAISQVKAAATSTNAP